MYSLLPNNCQLYLHWAKYSLNWKKKIRVYLGTFGSWRYILTLWRTIPVFKEACFIVLLTLCESEKWQMITGRTWNSILWSKVEQSTPVWRGWKFEGNCMWEYIAPGLKVMYTTLNIHLIVFRTNSDVLHVVWSFQCA